MHFVTGHELESIGSAGIGIHFGFFGVCLGIAASAFLGIQTANLDERAYAVGFAVAVMTGILTAFFGIMAAREWHCNRQRIKEIRARRVDPL